MRGVLRFDPTRLILPVVALLVVRAVAWFVANLNGAHGPLILGRVPGTLALALTAVALRRMAVTPSLSADTRRFWNQIAFVAALATVGSVIEGYRHLLFGRNEPV